MHRTRKFCKTLIEFFQFWHFRIHSDFLIKHFLILQGLGKVSDQIQDKYQIKCLKMDSKMTQEVLSKNISEQIINKICLSFYLNLKKFESISIEQPL
jgi:hypothetical protein